MPFNNASISSIVDKDTPTSATSLASAVVASCPFRVALSNVKLIAVLPLSNSNCNMSCMSAIVFPSQRCAIVQGLWIYPLAFAPRKLLSRPGYVKF